MDKPKESDETKTSGLPLSTAVMAIVAVLFLPLPAWLIDVGLSLSITSSIVILMVALWIKRPLEFSAFPTILLIITVLRLALNIATTRLILTNGAEGHQAAGQVISGFANLVMGGDFIIGTVIFIILLVINFIVITKGASRMAEVGARFALDGIPGKQMAIDADLSAGLIDEREAQRRRGELDEESAFFGAMDGASKFVRGDAIASLIVTGVNVFGGIIVANIRHAMPVADAVEIYTRLSVGDGLVSQLPALIISMAAGLVVAKGGVKGAVEKAVISQLTANPKALVVTCLITGGMAVVPGLPFFCFALWSTAVGAAGYLARRQRLVVQERSVSIAESPEIVVERNRHILKKSLQLNELEVRFGSQLAASFIKRQDELAKRVDKMRKKFAQRYGFLIPEIQLIDDLTIMPTGYQIRVHGTSVASQELAIANVLVILGDGPTPTILGRETREPAFGLKAMWIPEEFSKELKREGFTAVDTLTVLLTHISEAIRSHLSQLFSYKDLQHLLDDLTPEYKRLLDEIRPTHISASTIHLILKSLLFEGVSIRNLTLILEAIAEVAPLLRRADQITEHVRQRISQQLCGDLSISGVLPIIRIGTKWELAFHSSLKRDQRGDVIECDIDPRLLEEFNADATGSISNLIAKGDRFVLVCSPETRPYVSMIVGRTLPGVPVLSTAELARGVTLSTLGVIG